MRDILIIMSMGILKKEYITRILSYAQVCSANNRFRIYYANLP